MSYSPGALSRQKPAISPKIPEDSSIIPQQPLGEINPPWHQWLAQAARSIDWHEYHSCAWGYVDNGKWVNQANRSNYRPCFGDLSFSPMTITYIISSAKRTAERYYPFVDWLVNSSPWHTIFLEKNVAKIMEYGYVVNPKLPFNYVIGGLIATRLPWESPAIAEAWVCLVQLGTDPRLAFLLASMCYCYDLPMVAERYLGPNLDSETAWNNGGGNHHAVLARGMSLAAIKNFLNGSLFAPTRLTTHIYKGSVFNLWGNCTTEQPWLREKVQELYLYEGHGGRNNPFTKQEEPRDPFAIAIPKMAALSHVLMEELQK